MTTWAVDLKVTIEELANECIRLQREQAVATIDSLTARIAELDTSI